MALPLRRFGRLAAVALLVQCLASSTVHAGVSVIQGSAVGGVMIDAQGVLSNPTVDQLNELAKIWQASLDDIPADLDQPAKLRFVSLKALEAEIAKYREQLLPLPEAVQCLGGLQRVQYVLVYPEQGDIVLAGPAEGWMIDRWGNVVGKSSGRPVLLLDDLIVALRARRSSADGGLSCSINPTPEGIARVRKLLSDIRSIVNPAPVVAAMEEAMGDQVVTVTGVPQTSHFARAMVAADFRMKRIAMNFEPSPVADMPSFLHLMPAGRVSENMLPRWWLAPNYDPVHKSPDGLAWEIRGQGVKCMTESDYFAADGTKTHSGKASTAAQRWADTMTAKYDELASKDSAFGHLRNLMDLAIVAALIEKEQLFQKTSLSLPRLLEEEILQQFNAPQTIATQASVIKKGRNYIISASGGVQVHPWEILQKSEESQTVASVREGSLPAGAWWWDR
jgi:hypothetical protein